MGHGLRSGAGRAADPARPDHGAGAITQAGEGASQPVQENQENQGRNEDPPATAATTADGAAGPAAGAARPAEARPDPGRPEAGRPEAGRPDPERPDPPTPAGQVPRWLQRAAGWSWRLLLVGLLLYLAFRVASVLRLVVLPCVAAHQPVRLEVY